MTSPLRLSVLDLSPLTSGSSARDALLRTIELAKHAEHLGYTRFWVAEHHNAPSLACSAPDVLIGQIATATTTLRVGSGGVMLPNHAPLAVAERFRVLSALFPGRIDLGLGRAPGTDKKTAMALRGRAFEGSVHVDDFGERIEELFGFLWDDFPPDHPNAGIRAIPVDVAPPSPWVLGSTESGADIAARMGLPFAFARMFNPIEAEELMKRYRASFTASRRMPGAHAESIVAVSVVCAETDAEAERLAASSDLAGVRQSQGIRHLPFPSVEEALAHRFDEEEESIRLLQRQRHIIGGVERVRGELGALAEACEADEIMIMVGAHESEAQRRAYALLANAFGLGERAS